MLLVPRPLSVMLARPSPSSLHTGAFAQSARPGTRGKWCPLERNEPVLPLEPARRPLHSSAPVRALSSQGCVPGLPQLP